MPTRTLSLSLLAGFVLLCLTTGAKAEETANAASSAGPRRAPAKQVETASNSTATLETSTPSRPITEVAAAPAASSAVEPNRPADGRRLSVSSPPPREASPSRLASPLKSLMAWRPSSESMTVTAAGMAIAVGLMLSFVWLLRSLQPKSARPLPSDVVEVLGRVQLGGKQTTQLVRIGNKLLLVAVTPDGAETLTEVTDPAEVQAMLAACDTHRGRGASADFDKMLQQLSSEQAAPGFLDRAAEDVRHEPLGFADGSFDPRSLAAAYANTPGGRGDG